MRRSNTRTIFLICFLLARGENNATYHCDLGPEGMKGERFKEDIGRYRIEISGNAEAYIPGEQYTSKFKTII